MARTQSTKHESSSPALRRGMDFSGNRLLLLIVAASFLGATACSPEVGSDRWCQKMKETAKVDWSTREASDYAKHCLFKK